MNLKEIKPEEFASAIALINDEPERFQNLQTEAVEEIPVIKYVMEVYSHAVEGKAPSSAIEGNKATLSILTALYLLEKNTENPKN